jgi:hypothetical protein
MWSRSRLGLGCGISVLSVSMTVARVLKCDVRHIQYVIVVSLSN